MAIETDFSVAVNGDIRHVANTNTYAVLELHRWLMDMADDQAASTSGNDLVDIASSTPSERITNSIINLLNGYNIDDDASEYFYGGSISQDGGDTVYSGLQVLGAVNQTGTVITVVQDADSGPEFYDSETIPFWGDQVSPFNGNADLGVLMRILVKTRVNGFNINDQRVRLQARHYGTTTGDTHDFFEVQLGTSEAVGAISTGADPQNTTAKATVTAYTHVTNSGGTANAPTGGWQNIDIQDGNGDQPYYSKWTYGVDTSGNGIKGIWEYTKDLICTGSTKTCDGLTGATFQGITHKVPYTVGTGSFNEREWVVWGTHIWYDALTGGTFTRGNYVVFSGGAAGKIVYDDGVDECYVALEDTSITILDNETITEYDGPTAPPSACAASSVTAAVDTGTGGGSPIEDNGLSGGEGWVLAHDGTGDDLWIQLTHGLGPADTIPLLGITSGADATANGASSKPAGSPPKAFLGSYTGSLIGGHGVGIDPDDLGYPDTVEDLDGDTNEAPNNVIFTVDGLVVGEDYVLIGTKDTGNDIDKDQLILNTTLSTNGPTTVVCTASIPTDTPKPTGTIRVQLDVGTYRRIAYTSYATATFTTAATDWTDPNDATANNFIFVSYIDKLATATSETFTSVYSAPRTLWIRVRDGGSAGDGIPTKPFGNQGTLGANGGSITITRTDDV